MRGDQKDASSSRGKKQTERHKDKTHTRERPRERERGARVEGLKKKKKRLNVKNETGGGGEKKKGKEEAGGRTRRRREQFFSFHEADAAGRGIVAVQTRGESSREEHEGERAVENSSELRCTAACRTGSGRV